MFARLLAWLRPTPVAAPRVVLYTRADCPLCDHMRAELARARVEPPFELEMVDITCDPQLEARHSLSIPVLEIDGRAAFKGRLTAQEFERKYARRVAEIRDRASPSRTSDRESDHG
jgi:glutaredoxin